MRYRLYQFYNIIKMFEAYCKDYINIYKNLKVRILEIKLNKEI